MAYRGLAMPVVAKRIKAEDGTVLYTDGVFCGKAIKIVISPVYEDISDYNDINDTSEKKEFAYAKISLDTSELPSEAEQIVFGHEVSEDCVISRDSDQSGTIGFGMLVTTVLNGVKCYTAIWLHCVSFAEDDQNYNTRSNNSGYDTHQSSGVAVPEDDGTWRTKRTLKTKNDAASWLREMAGMKE